MNPIEVLLVEDNRGDVRLMQEGLKEATVPNNLRVVGDGAEALAYLHREGRYTDAVMPDLILLDLNLPRKNGHEVLAAIKTDPGLKRIPVIVLTSSESERDILKSYELLANCYIAKPASFDQFMAVVKRIEDFWLTTVKLLPK